MSTSTLSTSTSGTSTSGDSSSTQIWLYERTERRCWAVGYFDPAGQWRPESDHPNPEDAASRAHWLNGGQHAVACVTALDRAAAEVGRLEAAVDRLSAEATRWQLQARGTARRVRELQRRLGRR